MTEQEVMQFFCDRQGLESIEGKGQVKFCLFRPADTDKLKKIVGWAAVVIKKHNHNTFDEVMLDLLTFEDGIRSANLTGIPFFVVVSYTDGIYFAEYDGKIRMNINVKHGVIGEDPEPKTYAFLQRYDFGPIT
jgi:hypothetical protein